MSLEMSHPRILDLPNELLIRIFEYVEGNTSIDDLYVFDAVSYYIKTIQNLRLTCRLFHDTSSHLLLPFVKVNITPLSLARLDEVSRHPFISRGVRAIKLSLGPFYSSILAHDIQAFARYHATGLVRTIEAWGQFALMCVPGIPPPSVFQRGITRAFSLRKSWEKLSAQGVDTKCKDHLLLSKAHVQYLQLYKDHEAISGSIAQAIASAMTRMPTATWIKVDDDPPSWAIESLRPQYLDDLDDLLTYLSGPIRWSEARFHELGPPPFHLIGELLFSIQQLGIPLKGLDIETPPSIAPLSTANTATANEPAALSTAVKQLEAISFDPRAGIRDQYWTGNTPEDWVYFIEFLRNLLRTKSLRRINLNFEFMEDYDPPQLVSLGSLLLSYTWPNLQQLYFNGPFHFKELKAIVRPLKRTVKLQWCGYLMSGSWADVLDFLRECNAPCQLGNGNINGQIFGQECNRMNTSERNSIFRQNQWLESKATQYIRGSLPSNPVRDWDLGLSAHFDEVI